MKILIAEDDPVSRRLLDGLLSKWGYEPRLTADGLSAWDALQSEGAPSLVISDWMMPGMDGVELCRKTRRTESARYVYFIILTAKGRREDLFEAFEAGIDDFLSKPFDPQELRYRIRIGQRIIQLESRIMDLARTDPLTGALNRRAFMDKLQQEIKRAERQGSCISLILADIDHFKRINDTYGHPAGDEVIRAFARELESSVRPYDFLGRYGGEEFIVCLPGTPLPQSLLAAERLRKKVQAMELGARRPDDDPIRITASMGVCTRAPGSAQAADTLIASADAALYRAKAQGRNRVCRGEIAP